MLKCWSSGLEEYGSDKSKCQEHFDVYKECKKKECTEHYIFFAFSPLFARGRLVWNATRIGPCSHEIPQDFPHYSYEAEVMSSWGADNFLLLSCYRVKPILNINSV
ncbi:hypothetical protein Goari_006450 [Gossypium aridum]|uniref:Uncharacterized protein n=1 Tax=Gossypium aridum TaxID=34290 RepID=A0A7J8XPM0_GOSAI|nr:hypothetical protein [Gossypium aridum]